MSFFATYLLWRLVFRVKEFFAHWYLGGFRLIAHRTIALLESLDEAIALRITLRNFFKPLYGDYSVVGRALGFFFRVGRIVIGIVIYPILLAAALALYLAWAAIPLYLTSIMLGI